MASKITPEMLELLLPQKPTPALLIPRWGVVTSIAPLRVQLAGDDDPLPVTPKTLTGGLVLGGVVWCVLQGADLIVVAQLNGADALVTGTVTANTYTEVRPDGTLVCRGRRSWSATTGTQSFGWTFGMPFVGELPQIAIAEDTGAPQNVSCSYTSLALTGATVWHYRSTAVGNVSMFRAEGRWR